MVKKIYLIIFVNNFDYSFMFLIFVIIFNFTQKIISVLLNFDYNVYRFHTLQ